MPLAINAIRRETEPFTQLTAYFVPQNSAYARSKAATLSWQFGLPQFPLRSTSSTALISFSSKIGQSKFLFIDLDPPFRAKSSLDIQLQFINPGKMVYYLYPFCYFVILSSSLIFPSGS